MAELLRRGGMQAIRALLELAGEPLRWRSVNDLAGVLELPAPRLEQLLLRLRRAGLLEARRGRLGGYRLARTPAALPLAQILAAVGAEPGGTPAPAMPPSGRVLEAVGDPWTPGEGEAAADAGDRVLQVLTARLRAALERELAQLSLEDLLFDLRSARALLSEEGGMLLG